MRAAREALAKHERTRTSVSAHAQHRGGDTTSRSQRSYVSNVGRAVIRAHLGSKERSDMERKESALRDFAAGESRKPVDRIVAMQPTSAGGDQLDSLLADFVQQQNEWSGR